MLEDKIVEGDQEIAQQNRQIQVLKQELRLAL
mgnify:CR=1 FL=1